MRYDYICDTCEITQEVEHHMAQEPSVLCPRCHQPMRKGLGSPSILTSRWGNRETRFPERPSNAEYQAYRRFTETGRQDDYDRWRHRKGDL